jgi:3-deoxy-alpha-D-manno-octulosonate 8-oxidase
MLKNCRIVPQYIYGSGAVTELPSLLNPRREESGSGVIYIVDEFFEQDPSVLKLEVGAKDILIFAEVNAHEPTTHYINTLVEKIRSKYSVLPCAIVGIGGGSSMDISKAISNLLTNPGKAEDYQGWDLVKNQGIFKVGIPTLSGTGAETTRTCVMTSKTKKLGMNSDFSMFDQVILDPELLKTVPTDQEFYTGMDCYIHCVESLHGRMINEFSKAFAEKSQELCRNVFLDKMDHEKLMVASYLGGASIAMTMVGVVHPISAGLSKVFGVRHGLANCIVFNVIDDYYPAEVPEFHKMLEYKGITLPRLSPTEEEFELMIDECLNHDKPLWNALGDDWANILTRDEIRRILDKMC